jgi:hypothetical protein
MLKNGKFIKEKPVRIGAHYKPPLHRIPTDEDLFARYIVMGEKYRRPSDVGVGVYLAAGFSGMAMIVLLANILAGLLLE